jgi:hypothetical protein
MVYFRMQKLACFDLSVSTVMKELSLDIDAARTAERLRVSETFRHRDSGAGGFLIMAGKNTVHFEASSMSLYSGVF